jgi:signal transduction histidine kinase
MSRSNPITKSSNIKIALLFAAVCIVIPTLWYTHQLVEQLQKKEREVASLYAKSLEYIANNTNTGTDYTFIFTEIIGSIDFPVILADKSDSIISTTKNIHLDSTLTEEQQNAVLMDLKVKMDEINKPIVVSYQDSLILSYLHYGESPLVVRLRWLPYIEIAIASLFILVGYVGFSYIKRSEQSNIWVGMARETAHQLGTPLTSIMGWIELLKLQGSENPKILDTITEFENDVQRLTKVADRFSKIGSQPDLREENLVEIIQRVIEYFKRRLPQMGKKVDLSLQSQPAVLGRVNKELFEWVLENLVKNALDAMEEGKGSISFAISQEHNRTVIDVRDTGKGIDPSFHKEVFRPGYSTKKRGWGLGLSLSQRIIEIYHKGKIFVKESKIGEGTTFRIVLK